jgi:putative Mg2+ transporter-C (MgtC) family protein
MISHLDMVGRIAAGAALGAVIGYERDLHGRPVGLRTHLLVAMTAATFMVVSAHFAYFQHFLPGDPVEVDGSRIAASVVSGIGFLAGGAILRTGATIQGLTTAAGLWLVSAIGLCAGAGMYVEGVSVTALGVAALTILRRFEDKNDQLVRRRIVVALDDDRRGAVLAAIGALGAVVHDVAVEKRLGEKKRTVMTFDVQMPRAVGVDRILEDLAVVDGVRRIRVHRDS